jgi:hypothetical protein
MKSVKTIIKNLLKFQEYDLKYFRIKHLLKEITISNNNLESTIISINKNIENLKEELQAMKITSNEIDINIKIDEEKILKYQNQQQKIKKNEEFIALNQQIKDTKRSIEIFENKGLELIIQIDKKAEENNKEIEIYKNEINKLSSEIQNTKHDILDYQSKSNKIEKNIEIFEKNIDKTYILQYRQIAKSKIKKPYIVALQKNKYCSGCHLKVSNDIAKKIQLSTSITQCDNCNRILYF